MKQNPIIELLDRFMRGEASVEETRQLIVRLQDKESGGDILHLYRQRWTEMAHAAELDEETQERMYCRLKDRMQTKHAASKIEKKALWPIRWVRYVAVLLLFIGVGVGVHVYTRNSLFSDNSYRVEAEKGQRASVTLPDGTRVWLNSHSSLTYKADYGARERLVSLSGEAYFEVAKDPQRRFVVDAQGMNVEAIGTAFNVKAYQEDPSVITTLLSGRVRISTSTETALLAKGEQVEVNKREGKLKISAPDRIEYASLWRSNELAFNSHTLEEIAQVLDRMYNVKIVFEDEKIKKRRFSGIIQNNSLDNVIEILSLTASIEYRTQGDTVILRTRQPSATGR